MKKLYKILLFLPALLWMLCIFYLSAQTAEVSAETSGSFIENIFEMILPDFSNRTQQQQADLIDSFQFVVRKSAHFSAYLFLVILLFVPLNFCTSSILSSRLLSLLIVFLFAVSDEIHQYFVPGRSCEIRDILVDCCGALTGLVLLTLCLRIFHRRNNKF